MCQKKYDELSDSCSHCPPLQLMKDFEYIIDYYFDHLKIDKQKGKEKN